VFKVKSRFTSENMEEICKFAIKAFKTKALKHINITKADFSKKILHILCKHYKSRATADFQISLKLYI
jgi:hypothetical protein